MAKAAPSTATASPGGTTPPIPASEKTSASSAAAGGGLKAWMPALAVLLLAPVCTWAVGQFVLIPQMQKKLLSTPAGAEAAAAEGEGHGEHGKEGKEGGAPNYEFQNVVVNLAGTMGTRYLKTSFLVTGAEPDIKSVFEANKPRLTDVTLNVLSSLSLADLEEPGAKNVLREKLVAAYNQALGKKVAEQVYFSDFVVQ
jgi:flagellar FliL protein